jgi:CRISPR-associated protein Cst2
MSKHLFGLVLTPFGTAANNRGETEGNTTTLQKLVWKGQTHTTVSAEAIRGAMRWYWQRRGETLNRRWDENKRNHSWADPDFAQAGQPFVDDDVLGFMSAQAAKADANEAENTPHEETSGRGGRGRAARPRGGALVRRARLEVTRAISLQPWSGDVTFNAASPGATPSASRTGGDPVPYSAEVHATRYQYGFALTPGDLYEPERAPLVLDAIAGLSEVAGNHARFLYDFSPAAIVLRWTDDFAPRFLYAFDTNEEDRVSLQRLLGLIQAGDLPAEELYVGGDVGTADRQRLEETGAHLFAGVGATIAAAKHAITADR